jgi:hypothetical protein
MTKHKKVLSMKLFSILFCGFIVFLTASSLRAGDFILYGGLPKPGKISFSSATTIPEDLLKGQYGSTYGIRFSKGRGIGYEQNISYSPRFAKSGVKAFQLDSNLVLQPKGKIAPYATAGIGFIYTWGQEFSKDLDLLKLAASAFSFGKNFSVNYGAGLKLRKIAGPLGLNIDVRGYTMPGVNDGTLNFVQTSLGAVFSW